VGCFFAGKEGGPWKEGGGVNGGSGAAYEVLFCEPVEVFDGVGGVAEAGLHCCAVGFEAGADGGEVHDAGLGGEEGDEGLAHL